MQTDPARVFAWPVRVYYEDTDFGGVVYYANYLRFFERARTEWLRSLGVDQQRLAAEEGLQFVVRRAEIDFRRGARLDDELSVTVEVMERKHTYVRLRQCALRGAEPMAEAMVQAACIRRDTFKPAPLPAALAARLAAQVDA